MSFGLAAAPLAWALQTLTGYGLTSQPSDPGAATSHECAPSAILPVLMTLDLAATFLCVVALFVAWRCWTATREEQYGSRAQLLEIGEGRTRFLAMCGMLVSAGFLVASLFTSLVMLISPLCS
ncbi:MAG: hypothetical protein ABI616_12280 [Pseudomonadota bacterium]